MASSERLDAELRVLLVDDNSGVRRSTADVLKNAGYIVEQASDGIEAIAILSARPFDAIVLDLALPNLSGIEVLDAQFRPPPVIIVSALEYYDADHVLGRFGTKIFAVLRKPVPPELLLTTLHDAVTGTS